jgi:hypothetical protein
VIKNACLRPSLSKELDGNRCCTGMQVCKDGKETGLVL